MIQYVNKIEYVYSCANVHHLLISQGNTANWSLVLAFDTIVVLLTIYKTYMLTIQMWKFGLKDGLGYIIFRDGSSLILNTTSDGDVCLTVRFVILWVRIFHCIVFSVASTYPFSPIFIPQILEVACNIVSEHYFTDFAAFLRIFKLISHSKDNLKVSNINRIYNTDFCR